MLKLPDFRAEPCRVNQILAAPEKREIPPLKGWDTSRLIEMLQIAARGKPVELDFLAAPPGPDFKGARPKQFPGESILIRFRGSEGENTAPGGQFHLALAVPDKSNGFRRIADRFRVRMQNNIRTPAADIPGAKPDRKRGV